MSMSLNGRRRDLVASGAIWPLGIIALLAMNMSIVGITIYYATNDPSVAAEPNYYEKAVKWDQTAAQSTLNERLGWQVRFKVEHASGGTIVASVCDAGGAPVEKANVMVEAFHHARSASRRSLNLMERENGEYACRLGADRAGMWRLRLVVRAGSETFTSETDIDVHADAIDGSV